MEAALIRGESKSKASRAKQKQKKRQKNEHSERGDIQEEKGWQVLTKKKTKRGTNKTVTRERRVQGAASADSC
jgi:hypothetical protein